MTCQDLITGLFLSDSIKAIAKIKIPMYTCGFCIAKSATVKRDVIIKFVRTQIIKTIFPEDFVLIRFMKPANIIAMPEPINHNA